MIFYPPQYNCNGSFLDHLMLTEKWTAIGCFTDLRWRCKFNGDCEYFTDLSYDHYKSLYMGSTTKLHHQYIFYDQQYWASPERLHWKSIHTNWGEGDHFYCQSVMFWSDTFLFVKVTWNAPLKLFSTASIHLSVTKCKLYYDAFSMDVLVWSLSLSLLPCN